MPEETTPSPPIIRPGSAEDPYSLFGWRLADALDRFADIIQAQSAEYWANVAQGVSVLGDEDPDRPGNLREDPKLVLAAISLSQKRATLIYRRACHEAALNLTSAVFYAIDGAGLHDLPGQNEKTEGKLCQSKSD